MRHEVSQTSGGPSLHRDLEHILSNSPANLAGNVNLGQILSNTPNNSSLHQDLEQRLANTPSNPSLNQDLQRLTDTLSINSGRPLTSDVEQRLSKASRHANALKPDFEQQLMDTSNFTHNSRGTLEAELEQRLKDPIQGLGFNNFNQFTEQSNQGLQEFQQDYVQIPNSNLGFNTFEYYQSHIPLNSELDCQQDLFDFGLGGDEKENGLDFEKYFDFHC
jgi:hypothetical protein